ncbi:unnamed protein product (macronuclear) [Paramecium tetraurelia]|uniref:Uncharacterized protein n=1 Tax=Paramecium tetraurelia TaxID=5888 RepID=A0BET9_PARTE|nr:uncharacterized protein GSPATT00028089001 [Paramecium tetraurelia]CAK57056.1 unnamed protein product [Paramecium tetraurelia]|eukprot:XP_001424454.1 hypothetical protein (macronuclear) [Paramecium tetraurelia strain d4-2]
MTPLQIPILTLNQNSQEVVLETPHSLNKFVAQVLSSLKATTCHHLLDLLITIKELLFLQIKQCCILSQSNSANLPKEIHKSQSCLHCQILLL